MQRLACVLGSEAFQVARSDHIRHGTPGVRGAALVAPRVHRAARRDGCVACRGTRATASPNWNKVANVRMRHEECKHTASIMTPVRTLLATCGEFHGGLNQIGLDQDCSGGSVSAGSRPAR